MKNRTKTIFLILIVTLPLLIQGQSSRFQFGIEVGSGVSILRLDPFFYPSKWCTAEGSYMMGIVLSYNFTDKYALNTNLIYERFNIKDKYDYIVLPILFKVKIGKTRSIFVNLGPYFSYLFYIPENDLTNWRKYDLGITMGVGVETPISKRFCFITEIRNNLGFVSMGGGEYYNCVTTIQLGFLYNFGKLKSK
jgi:hypothetical protein